MALKEAVKVRLSPEKHLLYEDEAARRGKPLGTYLRERLEAEDDMRASQAALASEMAAMRRAVEDLEARVGEGGGAEPRDTSAMLEILLLLRALCGPDKMKMVQAELRRVGFDIWQPPAKEV